MKIVPLTLLKPGSVGKISDLVGTENAEHSQRIIKRLTSIGFYPGQDVRMVKKLGNIYSVKPGSDNTFAIDKTVLNMIKVQANDQDVFETLKESKKAYSYKAELKDLINFFKDAFKKN